MNIYRSCIKSAIDLVFALAIFLVVSPVMLLIYLVLLLTERSNPVFVQERPGLNSKVFKIYKFKTMRDIEGFANRRISDDQRLTTVGRFLRASSLDELPQLLNILRGEMSFVGPRPLRVEYLSHYTPFQARRHEVRPGITGLAQIQGRNLLDWEERFVEDVKYVETLSFWLDIKILIKTAIKVLRREGISSSGGGTMPPFVPLD